MSDKDWFSDSDIIAQESLDHGLEGSHYFPAMCFHKEAFVTNVQIKVELLTGII